MQQAQKIRTVNILPNKYMYTGKMSQQQIFGNSHHGKKYCEPEGSLNNYQMFLLNRALYGLSVYSQDDIREMHWEKRKRVIKVHKRAQEVLNLWKQEITNKMSKSIMKTLFPNSRVTKAMAEEEFTDPGYINKMGFKSLGITKEGIILKLISVGVLPKDFNELKMEMILCK